MCFHNNNMLSVPILVSSGTTNMQSTTMHDNGKILFLSNSYICMLCNEINKLREELKNSKMQIANLKQLNTKHNFNTASIEFHYPYGDDISITKNKLFEYINSVNDSEYLSFLFYIIMKTYHKDKFKTNLCKFSVGHINCPHLYCFNKHNNL